MPAIPEPSGQVAIYVSGSDCSPERPVSSDELGWLYVGLGSIAGLHERPLTGIRFLWLWRSETAGR